VIGHTGPPSGSADWCIHAVLVHSPLVGPATLEPLAAALEAAGWSAIVADLRPAIDAPASFRRAAATAARGADVVIGHSGAGAFLPIVAADAGVPATVFVDAVVSPDGERFAPSAGFVQFLDALPVVDGRLPPWHRWWPDALMAELVPDAAMRRRIEAEIPAVPRSFYDGAVPLPPRWTANAAAYLQLSPAYDDDRARADGWTWPTDRIDGHHLDVCTRPALVAAHIRELVSRLGVPPR
jgi:hypothetical protein